MERQNAGKVTGQLARSGGQGKLDLKVDNSTGKTFAKRGFTNYTRKEYAVVNLEQLNRFENGTEVTVELLQNCGMVKDLKSGVKVLGDGELEKKLVVKANKFSKSAVAMIEKAGGKAEVI